MMSVKDIPGYPRYKATPDGHIWDTKLNRFSKEFYLAPDNYYGVHIVLESGFSQQSVHRLVCLAFHGQPPTSKHETRHLNGKKHDNKPTNLTWGTRSENVLDSVRHGTHYCCKMTIDDVKEARRLSELGLSHRDIAEIFGVARCTISERLRNASA